MRLDRRGQTEWLRVSADGLEEKAITCFNIDLLAQRGALALELAACGMGVGKQQYLAG